MQQTTTTTSNIRSPVHIKVAHENEFRRFLLNPVSYEQLVSTLKALFNLSTEEFRIKFQDDENDWVLLTTDQELVYATELSGSPLRLQIKLLESNTTVKPTCEGFKGRGGRGCRGGKGLGRGGCKSPEERLTTKSSRLAERINQLETKLNSEQLTSERERVIRWRLAKLQEKVAFLKAMKDSLPASQPNAVVGEETATPVQETSEVPAESPQPWGRGRRGGRGCGRRAMCEEGEEPRKGRKGCCKGLRVDPELVAKFRQCKADLHAARESGDAEKINACLEAFKSAKAAKMEARAALRAQATQACTDEERA